MTQPSDLGPQASELRPKNPVPKMMSTPRPRSDVRGPPPDARLRYPVAGNFMPYCSFCGTALAVADVRFCSDCGKPVSSAKTTPNPDDLATIDYSATATSPLPPRPPSSSSQRSSSRTSASIDYLVSEGRFLPGRLIAGRYRIIALLGKGGMGEVYRADDLKLGQPVALKFLPDHLMRDGAAVARFHREVRVARQVSHICIIRDFCTGHRAGSCCLCFLHFAGRGASL